MQIKITGLGRGMTGKERENVSGKWSVKGCSVMSQSEISSGGTTGREMFSPVLGRCLLSPVSLGTGNVDPPQGKE